MAELKQVAKPMEPRMKTRNSRFMEEPLFTFEFDTHGDRTLRGNH